MKAISFILFFISINAYTANDLFVSIPKSKCSNVDVTINMDKKMKKHFSTPRNQDSIGWCYGFAAADLISAELGKPISASHVSANYNREIDNSILLKLGYSIGRMFLNSQFEMVYEGGFIGKAIKSNMKIDLCSEEEFPFDRNYYGEIKDLIQRLEFLKKVREFYGNDLSCLEAKSIIDQFDLDIEIKKLLYGVENHNLNTFLSEIINKNCKKKIKIPPFSVASLTRPRMSKLSGLPYDKKLKIATKKIKKYFSKIDGLLRRGKPIGVSYNVKHVTSFNGLHASVLTARRWKYGKCQFKIRNSWGKGCASYDRREVYECNAETGEIWITDQKFLDMVFQIEFIN